MKRNLKPLLIAVLLGLLGLGLAEYKPEDDVEVNVDAPIVSDLAEAAGVGKVGDALFRMQEAAHNTVTKTTGAEVDHYYVKLCLGKKSCVPVDPFKVSR